MMTLTLNISPELLTDLTAQAAQAQLPVEEYALRVLAASAPSFPKFDNGADLVQYWKEQGLIGYRSDIADPVGHSRNLRDRAESREHS